MSTQNLKDSTVAIHGGRSLDSHASSILFPLYQTSTFVHDAVGVDKGFSYSRVSNPTVDALEKALGALEGTPPAVCFRTGMAAITTLFLSLLKTGDYAVISDVVYGGTMRLFREVLDNLGITSTFVDSSRLPTLRPRLLPQPASSSLRRPATDVLSYNIGTHQFRFGGEFRKAQLDEFYYRNGEGTFSFDGSQGSYKINPYTDSNVKALADYLAGKVVSSSLARGDAERLVYVNSYNLFAQDAWQLTRRLNLNYGIRYDYEGPLHDGKNDLPTFVPGKGGLVVQGNGIDSLFPPQHTNFAPRVGFALQPRENKGLVIRGAYGIFFDAISLSPFLDNRPSNGGPNGFEGNPAGTSPVQTVSQNAYLCSGFTVQLGSHFWR